MDPQISHLIIYVLVNHAIYDNQNSEESRTVVYDNRNGYPMESNSVIIFDVWQIGDSSEYWLLFHDQHCDKASTVV